MCTIGAVFCNGQICTFKQCDLIPVTVFNEPEIRPGKNGVCTYTAMTRQGSKGLWAGINDTGVGFVAADSYTTTAANYYTTSDQADALFAAYETSISSHTNAIDAAMYLSNFYQDMGDGNPFPAPDISMITGWQDEAKTQPIAIFIEYMPNPYNRNSVRTIERTDGYFASTNNFRLQPDSVNYPANHSTYLRLRRAEMLLQQNPNSNGVRTLLKDQYYGKTELSICRETTYIGQEFHTQATVVFTASVTAEPMCEYQINGNPMNNPLKAFKESKK